MNRITYRLNDKPILVNDFNVYRKENDDSFDMFDIKIPCEVIEKTDDFYKGRSKAGFVVFDRLGMADNAFEFCRLAEPQLKYYLTAEIVCKVKTNSIILIKGSFCAKIWIDNLFVGIHNYGDTKLIVPFKKGICRLVFETAFSAKSSFLSCRISPVEYEDGLTATSLTVNSAEHKTDMVKIIRTDSNCSGRTEFVFMALPYDHIDTDLEQTIHIKLFKRYPRRVIKRFSCRFFEVMRIPVSSLKYDDADKGNNLFFECNYIDRTGRQSKDNLNIFTEPVRNFNLSINTRAKELLSTYSGDKQTMLYLEYLITKQDLYGLDNISGFYTGVVIKNFIKSIGTKKEQEHFLPYSTAFYIKSKLDGRIFPVFVKLPFRYNPKKEYPLVINITYGESRECKCCDNNNLRAIFAEIWVRGTTFGSYIGEAAFFEVINEVFCRFRTDKSRIYGIGYSNTSSILLALAGNYPDFFAGLYLVSGSTNIKTIKNLTNSKVLFVSSKNDVQYKTSFLKIKKAVNNIQDINCVLAEKYCHYNLKHLLYNTSFISRVINKKRSDYPNEISFYTEHNIHNKSYWITLHSIKYGKKSAYITARAINNRLDIKVNNATGFTVRIPPYIDILEMKLTVNNKTVGIPEIKNRSLTLYFTKNGYMPYEENSRTEIYKGLGLLYVYFRPLTVLTDTKNTQLYKIAESFSGPSYNSFMPIIGCKYPIEDINGFNIDQNKSWILLDNNTDNKIMEKVRNSCVIKTDKLGYEYLGDRYDGGYVIMQVADHPYSNQKEKVLYLNTNDSELLKSHILLRRVLLPSYIYGLHPYWNNAALIYCREGYKSVFEYGLKQEPIRKQVNNNG